jgi:UDP-N-acetylmuramyl pentapeptide phosphotransferase/UDP-N-acetylglucosamine-1-phosphate transferase
MMAFLIPAGFLASVLLCWMVRQAGVLDHPNHRSSHSLPIPRGGGLGVLAAIGIGLILSTQLGLDARPLALTAAGFGVLGLVDDLMALGTKLKFAIVIALASVITWWVGPVAAMGIGPGIATSLPYLAGFAGSVLWIFVAANATNFMDGSDGLIIAIFLPVALGLSVLGNGVVVITGLALTAGLIGFAIFNIPRAWLFLGDVGSLAIGAIVAVAGLQMIETPTDVWLFPLIMMPVLVDVLLTLVGKIRNRIGFLAPHRTHAYQLLVRMGWPHWRVALVYFLVSTMCVALAHAGKDAGGFAPFGLFVAVVVILSALHAGVRRAAIRSGLDLSG